MGIFENSKIRLFAGSQKIKKAYLGTEKIYSAGNVVTYHVDSGASYTVEVENGANILNQTPSKDGYTFVGWRRDKLATSTILTNAVMEDEPITLYAVFSKDITLTYYNATSKAATATDKQYYNNGNITNPKFTIDQLEAPSWDSRGWATDSKADAAVTYETIREREFSTDTTVYALYQRTITLSYDGNGSTSGSTASQTGIRYWNSAGNYSNPSFVLASNGYSRSNASFLGWALGSVDGTRYAVDATVTLSSSTTFYAKWRVSVQISASASYTELIAHPNAGTQTITAITLSTKYGGVISGVVTYTATGGKWKGGGFPATSRMYVSSNPSGLSTSVAGGWNQLDTSDMSASATISNTTSISIIWTQEADSGNEDDELFDWGFSYDNQILTATEVYEV